MVVGRGDVDPAAAKHGPDEADSGYERGRRARLRGEEVPEADQCEARAGGNGDEELEEGALGVAVADGRGHGREPFMRVALANSSAQKDDGRGGSEHERSTRS